MLLTPFLLSIGCTSLTPALGQRTRLLHAPNTGLTLRQGTSGEASGAPGAIRPSSDEKLTLAGLNSTQKAAGQRTLAAQLAFRGALRDVSTATLRISGELTRLNAGEWSLARGNPIFARYVDYGTAQLSWVETQLATATRLADASAKVDDPGMQIAVLRVAGPRLEAAMLGSLVLAVWVDVLHLADIALKQRLYSVETLFMDMWRWQEMLEPSMKALSSPHHEEVEAAAQDVPALVGHLTDEFDRTQQCLRTAAEHLQKALLLKEAIESVTLLSTSTHRGARNWATVGVGLDVDWRWLKADGSMDEGSVVWGYTLRRDGQGRPWRLTSVGRPFSAAPRLISVRWLSRSGRRG